MQQKKLKLLLVEDNRAAQMAGKMALTIIGCDVDIAASGCEAIQLTLTKNYDLIFMDIGLGDTDGYAVTREIRQQSAHSKTPIVALTAHNCEEIIQLALKSGMNKIMTKPLLLNDAKKIIAEFTPLCEDCSSPSFPTDPFFVKATDSKHEWTVHEK